MSKQHLRYLLFCHLENVSLIMFENGQNVQNIYTKQYSFLYIYTMYIYIYNIYIYNKSSIYTDKSTCLYTNKKLCTVDFLQRPYVVECLWATWRFAVCHCWALRPAGWGVPALSPPSPVLAVRFQRLQALRESPSLRGT